jgi:hypothetical protein
MLSFVPLVALSAFILQVTNFAKELRNWSSQKNAVVTQAVAWLAGVVCVLVFAQTQFAVGVSVAGIALVKLNFWSQVFIGLAVGSSGSTIFDGIKAVDNTQSTVTPTLIHDVPVVTEPVPPPA